MADTIVSINGTPQVYNHALVAIDGQTSIDAQGFFTSLSWDTGTLMAYIHTINTTPRPIGINAVNAEPKGSLGFAPGKFPTFYKFLNGNINTYFSIQFNYYTVGDLSNTQPILFTGCKISNQSGGVSPQSPANSGVMGFMCTDFTWL